jgi:hypothetical protein
MMIKRAAILALAVGMLSGCAKPLPSTALLRQFQQAQIVRLSPWPPRIAEIACEISCAEGSNCSIYQVEVGSRVAGDCFVVADGKVEVHAVIHDDGIDQ